MEIRRVGGRLMDRKGERETGMEMERREGGEG